MQVYATSVNPIDCKTRRGDIPRFMACRPKILGGDVAGVVVNADVGAKLKPGTRVAFLSDGFIFSKPYGAYAEFIAVPEAHVAEIPEGVDFKTAAGVPLVTLTAIQALDRIQLAPGQRVLVHAGAGGVGSAAIQVAKARGLHVTATCSRRNLDFVRGLGADVAIDYGEQRFEEAGGGGKYNAVLDLVGGDYERRSMRVLSRGGHYVSFLAKTDVWQAVKGMLLGVLGMLGFGFPRYHVIMVKPNGQQVQDALKLVQQGKLKPVIDKVMRLEQAREAHEYVEEGHTRGKVILAVKDLGSE